MITVGSHARDIRGSKRIAKISIVRTAKKKDSFSELNSMGI
jgi:hypothetical protein